MNRHAELSLNDNGPNKTERQIQSVMKASTGRKKSGAKGTSNKPGGAARRGKARERAENIVRNSKQKKGRR